MVRALGFFNSHAAGGGINWCFSGEQFDITFQVKKKKNLPIRQFHFEEFIHRNKFKIYPNKDCLL